MEPLLHFQTEILTQISSGDSLSIFSSGLGLEIIQLTLIKGYQKANNILLILNASKESHDFFRIKLSNHPNVKFLSGKSSPKLRLESYTSQGAVFINPRIFIYDILVRNADVSVINGIFVFNAHEVIESTHLSFCLKLFREKNTKAFIRSFSDAPIYFVKDFNQVPRTLRILFAKNMYLWPRFHSLIIEDLEKNPVDVIEIAISLSSHQELIQLSLLELISHSVDQLIKSMPELNTYKNILIIDNIISYDFFPQFFSQFSPSLMIYQNQFYQDIKILRKMLNNLTNLNAFEFYEELRAFKKLYTDSYNNIETTKIIGTWMLCPASETLYAQTKNRVDLIIEQYKKNFIPNLISEIHPKYFAFDDVINEIYEIDISLLEASEKWNVLILTRRSKNLNSFFKIKKDCRSYLNKVMKRYHIEPTSESNENSNHSNEDIVEEIEDLTQIDSKINYKIHSDFDVYGLRTCLESFKPHFVILFDVIIEWIRVLEIYKNVNRHFPLRVYLIIHKNSIEEKKYLISMENEKKAFETLITEKAILAKEENLLETSNMSLNPVTELDSRNLSTSVLGSVIVDAREFGSELPLILYKYGFNIHPCTLEVGDYVLSTDTVVERKSISDLTSSLNCGRLYDQAMALARSYANSFLLIEFSDKDLFQIGLSSRRYTFKSKSSPDFYIQSKLLLLTLHCPSLRLLWSTSPEYSAKLFHELKRNKEEPDPHLAKTLTMFEQTDSKSTETNKSYDFLLKLPGVNRKILTSLSSKTKNLRALSHLDLTQLTEIMGDKAVLMYNFFNTPYNNV